MSFQEQDPPAPPAAGLLRTAASHRLLTRRSRPFTHCGRDGHGRLAEDSAARAQGLGCGSQGQAEAIQAALVREMGLVLRLQS